MPKVTNNKLLFKLYEKGLSDTEIAKRSGVWKSTVWQWRKANGLPANSKNGVSGEKDICGFGYSGNICWLCANAYSGCTWSKNFQPVEGWTAKIVVCNGGTTYEIRECPHFAREERMYEEGQSKCSK